MEELACFLKVANLKSEAEDPQFLSIQKLFDLSLEPDTVLSLIILNSIICYQLTMTGEKYWENFADSFLHVTYSVGNFCGDTDYLLAQMENFALHYNKRLLTGKIARLYKMTSFIDTFGKEKKGRFYYDNMLILRDDLASTFGITKSQIAKNQGVKTVNLAVKMFGYGARNVWGFKPFPMEIGMPIDSRLERIFQLYGTNYNGTIAEFYDELSAKIGIAPLHLDAMIWLNMDIIMKKLSK